MSNNILKPLTLGAVIVGGLALAQSSFAMTSLAQGYLLSAPLPAEVFPAWLADRVDGLETA